ncbi:Hsp20/alpha crystallin family protein [Kitasatospora sp. KL5]|uniref:Hsp20/alpha crystallin family protein n=1 Tax=Kitasatospora sp. KL5 TaxID=3425125 RepID=UPI003D6FFE35
MANELRRKFPFSSHRPAMPEWFEDMAMRMSPGEHMIRIEESEEDGVYQVRAELPGIDPDKDVSVTVEDGLLTIHAERIEEKKEKHRSEFRYGSFTRTVQLPAGASETEVTAGYEHGVLTVRAPIAAQSDKPARKIEITRTT